MQRKNVEIRRTEEGKTDVPARLIEELEEKGKWLTEVRVDSRWSSRKFACEVKRDASNEWVRRGGGQWEAALSAKETRKMNRLANLSLRTLRTSVSPFECELHVGG